MGFIFAQGLPSGVWCAVSALSYCFVSYFCSPPTAKSRTWILDNCDRIDISSPKPCIVFQLDDSRELRCWKVTSRRAEQPERSLSSQLQFKRNFGLNTSSLVVG